MHQVAVLFRGGGSVRGGWAGSDHSPEAPFFGARVSVFFFFF